MNGDIVKIRQKLKTTSNYYFFVSKDIKINERIEIGIWSVFSNFS